MSYGYMIKIKASPLNIGNMEPPPCSSQNSLYSKFWTF